MISDEWQDVKSESPRMGIGVGNIVAEVDSIAERSSELAGHCMAFHRELHKRFPEGSA